MRDRAIIMAGLAVFMAAVTVPFWCARAGAKPSARQPELTLPANAKQCVAPPEKMRAEHMQMLVNWREDVVRRGDRQFVAYNGKVYEKSLSSTCLRCHNKREFCDRCHAYSGVSGPYCWNCHNEPQTTTARSMP
jgi:hypothetical protein